ncbi:AcrR family transcriptional regulator [Pedobacter cryoconitis]|uniref:AcrR family transcriptional regulator n=1 Tax=Pedobacter cryoconitis TaxID=188932 RepID=A0A7W9E0D6_9SPHI|nr:TetR/AcrR family transcriptional regulator [Pedobacter cryoconitis]MBB5638287.1 AcrR family transcriptional regulator [Pedobacter cryoconitis]
MGKAEETRKFIIEKAAPVFNQKGIAGTTVDDILSATGMAKGGIYGRFENRDELARESVDYLLEKLGNRMTTIMAREKTAIKKLFAYMNDQLDPINSFIPGGCPILNFSVEADDTDPVMRNKLKAVIERGQNRIITTIQQGVENGELSSDINAEDFALQMFASLEGGMMMSRVSGNSQYMAGLVRMLKAHLKSYEIK